MLTLRITDHDLTEFAVGRGKLTVDSLQEELTVDSLQWAVGSGQWTVCSCCQPPTDGCQLNGLSTQHSELSTCLLPTAN